jgi:FAD/FMN-containing dehydrogenase
MNAEIGITGTNAEVALGQWEYQVLGAGVRAGGLTSHTKIDIVERPMSAQMWASKTVGGDYRDYGVATFGKVGDFNYNLTVHNGDGAANITATAFDGEKLFVRLIGEQTMAASWGGVESLEDDTNFWQQIKNQQHSFFQDDKPLWRISLPPATSMLTIPGETLIEWGGGLCWLKSHSPEPEIRDLVLQQGGHATLFRANGLSAEPFQPLPAVLFKLHQQLKKSLDPQGIFNPGKMYSGL